MIGEPERRNIICGIYASFFFIRNFWIISVEHFPHSSLLTVHIQYRWKILEFRKLMNKGQFDLGNYVRLHWPLYNYIGVVYWQMWQTNHKKSHFTISCYNDHVSQMTKVGLSKNMWSLKTPKRTSRITYGSKICGYGMHGLYNYT